MSSNYQSTSRPFPWAAGFSFTDPSNLSNRDTGESDDSDEEDYSARIGKNRRRRQYLSASARAPLPSRDYLTSFFNNLNGHGRNLPAEIREKIADYIHPKAPRRQAREWNPIQRYRPDASGEVPPANGRSPFMELPNEIRTAIFAYELHSRDIVFEPQCQDDCKDDQKDDERYKNYPEWLKVVQLKQRRRPNRVSSLMTLNKVIHDEIFTTVYEHRFFAIHVHGGLKDGGIEFLKLGRQPLQYLTGASDLRFNNFTQDADHGFARVKKIIITIFPPAAGDDFRHNSIQTYHTVWALCNLLTCGRGTGSINHIIINFSSAADEKGAQDAENYWWDSTKQEPKTTSFEGLRNIEMALRPFGNLTGCHNVEIELPPHVSSHPETVRFAEHLQESMESKLGNWSVFEDDSLEMNLERARTALEEHLQELRDETGGYKNQKDEGLSADDFQQDLAEYWDEDDEEDDSSTVKDEDEDAPHENLRRLGSDNQLGFDMKELQEALDDSE